MADTKESREEQARDEEDRQRERALQEALDRGDEPEPPRDVPDDADGTRHEAGEQSDRPRQCHRRDCDEPATFVVLERYQDSHGAVEAAAALCREHTAEERPSNLDGVYADYVFRVTPIPGAETAA